MLNKYILIFLIPITFLLSCRKPPNYSDTPAIEFKSISKDLVFDEDIQAYVDSISITIEFQDGDGNLGLDNSDVENSPIYVNEFVNNYFVDVYKKVEENWELIDFESVGSTPPNARFPRLLVEAVGPIDGDLNRAIILTSIDTPILQPNDTLRFEIYILDRDFNQSNSITTDYIVYGVP